MVVNEKKGKRRNGSKEMAQSSEFRLRENNETHFKRGRFKNSVLSLMRLGAILFNSQRISFQN